MLRWAEYVAEKNLMGRKAQEEKEETVVPQSPPRAAPY
jgi:hypothetical protein